MGECLPRRDLTQVSLQAIVEACPLAMLALDRDGMVRIWSQGAEQMFGWTKEEPVAHTLSPSLLGCWKLKFSSSSTQGNEFTWPRKNGKLLYVSFFGSSVAR